MVNLKSLRPDVGPNFGTVRLRAASTPDIRVALNDAIIFIGTTAGKPAPTDSSSIRSRCRRARLFDGDFRSDGGMWDWSAVGVAMRVG